MNFRIFAATACATLLGASAVMVPTATAATVDIRGNICTITFSQQDLNDIQNLVANADNESLALLKAEFPTIGDRFDSLFAELADQMEKYGDIYFSSLSEGARNTYYDYIFRGLAVGYTQNDLTAMLIAPLLPAAVATGVTQELGALTGPIVVSKTEAQARATLLSRGIATEFGFDIEKRTYANLVLSPRAFEIVQPSMGAFQTLADEFAEPFAECAADRGNNTGGNGGGIPNTPTGGGSSFGSS